MISLQQKRNPDFKYKLVNYFILTVFFLNCISCSPTKKYRRVYFDSSIPALKIKVGDETDITPCSMLIPTTSTEATLFMPDGKTMQVPFKISVNSTPIKNKIKKAGSLSLRILSIPLLILGGGVLGIYCLDSNESDLEKEDLAILLGAALLTGLGVLLTDAADKLDMPPVRDKVFFDFNQ